MHTDRHFGICLSIDLWDYISTVWEDWTPATGAQWCPWCIMHYLIRIIYSDLGHRDSSLCVILPQTFWKHQGFCILYLLLTVSVVHLLFILAVRKVERERWGDKNLHKMISVRVTTEYQIREYSITMCVCVRSVLCRDLQSVWVDLTWHMISNFQNPKMLPVHLQGDNTVLLRVAVKWKVTK